MDWFERLTGFAEAGYASTRLQLAVEGETLRSHVNGRCHGIGRFAMSSLATLREQVPLAAGTTGRLRVRTLRADVQALHADAACAGALFQVASQFNMLEMVSPAVTPEHGVTRYAFDGTQGPACAIAAGAATIYRNYFVPVPGGGAGQTAQQQLDGLADLGRALAAALSLAPEALWQMRNGYALASAEGLAAISAHLAQADAAEHERLRGLLAIGLHEDAEVTLAPTRQRVSQAFCSALPVAYSDVPTPQWESLARLVLEAAYEATLLVAVRSQRRGGSNQVLLTLLGGGAFGNPMPWIFDAIERALQRVAGQPLLVTLVSYGPVPATLQALADAHDQP